MQQGVTGLEGMKGAMAKANGVADQAVLLQSGYDTALKNATGSVEALQITIGSALLPVLTTLLNNTIAPGINWLTGFAAALFGNQKAFDDLGATAQAAVGVFQNIGKVFIGAFDFFAEGKLDNLFSGLTALFGGPAAGAIVDFADQIKTVFTAIPSIAAGALATLQGIVTTATGAILSAWSQYGSQILAAAQATWATVATTVNTAVAGVATIVSGVLSTVVGFWAQYGGQITATVTTTWGSIQTTVAAVITAMVPVVQGVLAQIATFWATNGAAIQATVVTVWGQIGSVVQAAMGFIQASVIPALAAIGSFVASHGTEIQAAMTGVWTNIRTSITSTLSGIQGVITGATQIIQGNWMAGLSSLASGTASILTGILAQFGLKLSDLSGIVQMQFQAVTMAGVTAMAALESSLAAGWNAIYAATIGKVTAMVSGVVASFAQQNPEIVGKLQQASASIGQIWGAIETRIGAAVGSIAATVGAGFERVQSVAVAATTALQSVLGTVWEGIKSVITTVVTTIASLIGVKFDEAHTSASTAMGGILSTISGMVGSFASAAAAIGKSIVDGIAGGIKRGAVAVVNAALDVANAALDSAKNALISHSPSQAAADQVGLPFSQGIAVGILQGTPFAVGAANVSAQTILTGAQGPIAAGAPLLGQALMQGLAVGLDANLSSAENVAATAAQGLIINTTGMLGASAQTIGQSLMGGTATGITAAAPVLMSSITATMDQATGKATETLGGAAATIGQPFAKGVAAGIFQNKGFVTDAASGLMQDTTLSARDILKIGGESSQASADLVGSPFGAGVAQGIADAAPAVGDAAKVVGEAGADTLPTALQPAITDSLKIVTDAKPSFVSAGKNLIAGMTEGVKAAAGALAAAAAAAARAALDAAQSELGIHSPSTEAAVHVGAPFVAGVGQGIAAATPDLERTATDMASAAIAAAHAGLSTRDAQTLGTTVGQNVGQGIANSNTESYWQKQIRLRDERLASLNTGGASFDLSEIDPGNLDKALGQMADIAKIVGAWAKKQTIDPGVAKKFAETTKIVSDAVSATVTLRQLLMDLGEPADLTAVAALVNELATILGVFQTQIGKNKLNVGLLKAYAEATSQAIGVIKTMLDARKGLSDPGPPIDMEIVAQLALEARIITRIVQTELVKYAQEERDAMAQEAAIVGSVVDIFKHVLDLRSAFQDPGPPIMLDRLLALADEANAMVVLLEQTINPAARAGQDQLAAFAANVQKTVDTFKAVLDLRKGLADPQMPISPAALQSLAADTDLLVQTAASLVPEGFALIDGLEAYASTAEKAESIFKGMADLRGSLATVAAPIDQQVVDQLAGELRKVVIRFYTDAIPLGTDLLNASQQYSTVAGQATSSIKGMVDLRAAIATIGPPVDLSVVDRLAGELRKVVIRFYTDAIPFAQQTVQAVDAYHAVAGNAISSLTDAAKLGTVLSAPSPIPLDVVKTLTGNLAAVVTLFVGGVIHYAQDLADQVSRYTAIAGNAITTIGNVAKLGSDLKDAPPIPMGIVKEMAASAVAIADLFTNTLDRLC
jgi:phage-related protein